MGKTGIMWRLGVLILAMGAAGMPTAAVGASGQGAPEPLDAYNVVWESPSESSQGSKTVTSCNAIHAPPLWAYQSSCFGACSPRTA